MIHLTRRGHLWSFSGHYSESLRVACKETPGMVWNAQARAWVGYEDAAALVVRKCAERRVAITGAGQLHSTGVDHKTNGKINGSPTQVTRVAQAVAPAPFAVSYEDLRDYQKTGVDFLVAHAAEGALLADATGLGKTAQAIRAARAFKEKTVIVCPAFVRGVWEKELARWWPAAVTANLRGLKAKEIDPTTSAAIINYEIAHAWVESLAAWGAKTLIVDEIHYLLSEKAKRTRAVAELARGCSYRMGLSATPMTSRPRDLWAPVDILCPGRFGRFFSYAERYCDGHKEQVTPTKAVWKTDGASNLEELNARLRYFMLRRTKADVSLELPALTRQVFEIEVGSKFCARPGPALRSDKALRAALDVIAEGKIDQVVEMIVEHLGAEHRVVCFTFRKVIAREIAERVGSKVRAEIGIITGDLDQKKRAAVVTSQPQLLAATMDSTGVGIDLSFADVAIFAELDWVPSKLVQCLDKRTEILTKDGFLGIGRIKRGDLVAAFDRDSGAIRYLPALSIMRRGLCRGEKMFSAVSDHIDLRVTGGHRMVYKESVGAGKKRWSEWREKTASDLSRHTQKYQIPVAGFGDHPGVDLTDDELRLIGWYLTDGCINGNDFSISQSVASRHIADIESCILGAGMRFTLTTVKAGTHSNFNRRHDQRTYHIPRFRSHKHKMLNCGWDRLAPYFDKSLSSRLFGMTRAQLAVMLEAIHAGNGSKEYGRAWVRQTYHITTGNKSFAENLQRLSIERGFRANLVSGKSQYGGDRYTINIKDSLTRSVAGTTVGRTNLVESPSMPGEHVWCVENSLGTLVVRRNGKTAIVGNCEGRLHRFGQKNAVLVQYPIARGSADEIIRSVCLEKLMRSDDVLGKADTKLREDLDGGGMTAVERLRGVYERIMAEEG